MIGESHRPDRSEEEREAARVARERARAERAARRDGDDPKGARGILRRVRSRAPAPATPAASADAPRTEPARPDPPPRTEPAARAEPPRPAPAPRPDPAPRAEPPLPDPPPGAEPRRAEPEPPRSGPAPRPDPSPRAEPPPAEPPPRIELPPHPAEGAPSPGAAAPRAAAMRASVRERADALLSSRRAGPPGGGAARDGGGRRRRRLVLAAALAVAAILAGWVILSLVQPFKGDGEGTVAVTIPRGSGVGEIGDLLEERDVVSSGFWFEARATLAGARSDLKPGIYNLKRDMSYGAAIDALTAGPPRNLINVTFPEGIALREIAPRVKKAGVRGDYVRASRRSSQLNPRRYGAKRARDLEGFLFPATYQLRRGSTARSLVDKQLAAFKREFAKVDLRAARKVNLTAYDVLIIASLVEREAQLDKERPLVASVIYNRLRAGMNLGIDATVRYAANNWTRPVTRSQLQSSSPYNTYNHSGLPPGPIGNPGLASMRAAARPARTKYLYYVVKPGTCGEHVFAETAAEHDRNSDRYDRARAARGGRSPTTC